MTTPAEQVPLAGSLGPPVLAPHSQLASEISPASRRLRALAALSGSLTDALSYAQAADLVEQKALSALGATSAVVVTLGAFPPVSSPSAERLDRLHVVHAIGLPREIAAALEQLPLAAPVPFAEVARTGEPRFLTSYKELLSYPEWGVAMIRAGARAAAIVPVWANGELRGVLGLSWAEPRIFDEDECAFVLTLGVMCAQAIMRAHLRGAEREAREGADTARQGAEHARDAAEKANQSKAHFVATISHELRTPMNAVLGYTELLVDEIDGPISALQKDHLGRVRESGHHLLALIEDLLGYARIEAGQETVSAETALLVDLVDQSLALIRPIAAAKGFGIRVEGPAEPVVLYTDVRKVKQVLVNLLANAVKFTDAGDVVLSLRVADLGAEVNVFFEVTDSGRGIESEDLPHVFDAFWQADSTSKKSKGSSGLGLSVARQLARLLGGDVVVEKSVVGRGSTFVFSLPVRYSGA